MLLSLLLLLLIFSILIVIHTYILYPIIIYYLSKDTKTQVKTKELFIPSITITIAAHNEEKVIKERIENINLLDYPKEKLEVIVGSDNSSDNTNNILIELEKQYSWLKVLLFNERRGKAGVLNDLVKISINEIVVFTDANTEFNKNAIKELVKGFSDENIGGISGKLILTDKNLSINESVEEKSYWDYEIKIKTAEGKLGILIGANGGIFAIRKKYFKEIPTIKAVTDDLFITLSVLSAGKKFIYNPLAIAIEDVGCDVKTELKRKIRFAATNFQTMLFFKNLLFNKNILLSFAFWSHKILRWIFPFVMILLFVTNILVLYYNYFFQICFFIQVLFYLLSFIGYFLSLNKIRVRLFSFPFFFVASNIALLIGFFRFLRKKHSVIWQTTSR